MKAKKNKSIWDRTGEFYYQDLSSSEKKELEALIEDMQAIYGVYRSIQVKYIITKIKDSKSGSSSSYGRYNRYTQVQRNIDEWDLKNFAIIASQLLEENETTMEEVRTKHAEMEEEIKIALNYISGIFKNAKIWRGHIDLLRSYKRQLEAGLPLTEKQADTLFKLLHRYSKQVVSNQIL